MVEEENYESMGVYKNTSDSIFMRTILLFWVVSKNRVWKSDVDKVKSNKGALYFIAEDFY